MKRLYEKHREFMLYAVFGAGTVAVDVGVYTLFVEIIGIRGANAAGWCGAVLFAFLPINILYFRPDIRGAWPSGGSWRNFWRPGCCLWRLR